MDDATANQLSALRSQVEALQTLLEVRQLREAGLVAIARRLIAASPNAVRVDEVEEYLLTEHGATTPGRDEGQRRSDIFNFLHEVGLMRRSE